MSDDDNAPAGGKGGYPWIKFFTSDWLAETRGLKPADAGIYIHLIAMMAERGEPIAFSRARLKADCNATSQKAFDTSLDKLLERELIKEDGGRLWCDRVEQEIKNQREKSKKNSRSAKSRWKKGKQKQAPADANAMRYQSQNQSQKVSEDALQEHSSDTDSDDEDLSWMDGDASPLEGDGLLDRIIDHDEYGRCDIREVGEDTVELRSVATGETYLLSIEALDELLEGADR